METRTALRRLNYHSNHAAIDKSGIVASYMYMYLKYGDLIAFSFHNYMYAMILLKHSIHFIKQFVLFVMSRSTAKSHFLCAPSKCL